VQALVPQRITYGRVQDNERWRSDRFALEQAQLVEAVYRLDDVVEDGIGCAFELGGNVGGDCCRRVFTVQLTPHAACCGVKTVNVAASTV